MNTALLTCLLLAVDVMPPALPVIAPAHIPLTSRSVPDNVRMVRKMAATPAYSEVKLSSSTLSTVKMLVIDAVTSESATLNVLVISTPNPTKAHYTVKGSTDLKTWTELRSGSNDNPIVVYDFGKENIPKYFYSIVVDSNP